jgi:predicted amidohydrolase YtcJ
MRHRIEHCGLPLPPRPRRLADLGIVPVVQPHFLWFDGDVYMERVGPERSRWLYPIRTLLDHGLAVAGSSDGPVVPSVSPLLGVFAAVTRRSRTGPVVSEQEAVTVEEALDLFTWRAAYACGEEAYKGTVEPGKMADFVILTEDPYAVPVDQLPAIEVASVCVGGEVYLPA